MNVEQAIRERRCYRVLEKTTINESQLEKLMQSIILAPSCFNKQPWRYVFVTEKDKLKELGTALTAGNRWALESSMFIAVFTKDDLDCIIGPRKYAQFDVGLATGMLILQATELNLIAHPMAGFNPKETARILKIPEEFQIICLIAVGKKGKGNPDYLSEIQKDREDQRPERLKHEKIVSFEEVSKNLKQDEIAWQ